MHHIMRSRICKWLQNRDRLDILMIAMLLCEWLVDFFRKSIIYTLNLLNLIYYYYITFKSIKSIIYSIFSPSSPAFGGGESTCPLEDEIQSL